MNERPTRRADDLVPGTYIYIDGVMHLLVFTMPLADDQLLLLANGETVTWRNDLPVEMAPPDEVFEAAAVAQASGRGLRNFPGLSPAIGPVREVFGPMYADPSGCERCGALAQVPGGIGLCADCEPLMPLNPVEDLSDVAQSLSDAGKALASAVEHGDSVGAFPVVAPATWCAHISCPKTPTTPGSAHPRTESCPTGFAPPSGHAAVLPPDALKHDRYNGENES